MLTHMLICDHCRKPASQLDLIWIDNAAMKLCPACRPSRPIATRADLPLVPANENPEPSGSGF
jgi:hypothetical protein